jgi:hypothetical protein
MQTRRSHYDVSNRVDVTDPRAVADAVQRLLAPICPHCALEPVTTAFRDFERLYRGEYPGWYSCDTLYHDLQHSLDVTLAMARLLHGHEREAPPQQQLGPRQVQLGVVTALFHDAGYIRRRDRDLRPHGAQYTRTHVSRSAEFLRHYLPQIGLGDLAGTACLIVHYTGFEVDLERVRAPEPAAHNLGILLGTADLIAQVADRCYLEKCRDRLYPEFVLGGLTEERRADGSLEVRYASGEDLLRQTPDYFDAVIRRRLDEAFESVYRYAEHCFGGRNFYLESMEANLAHLRTLLAADALGRLRRHPPRRVRAPIDPQRRRSA